MIRAIIDRLKTGNIKNVVEFGSQRPSVPYVVVKDEGLEEGGLSIRIIAHMPDGNGDLLRTYVQEELSTLLRKTVLTDSEGNKNELLITGEQTGIITGNDDGSLSMERVFLLPGFEF